MNLRPSLSLLVGLIVLALFGAACGRQQAVPTPVSATAVPPAATPAPATATPTTVPPAATTTPMPPTATSTSVPPTSTSVPTGPMPGVWGGSTDQSEKEIGFLITDAGSRLCGLSLNWSGSCGMVGGFTDEADECTSISSDGRFTYEREGTSFGSDYVNTIAGSFSSATTATGTFQHEEGSCEIGGSWNASLTDLPTPTPRPCPTIQPGQWSGAADFTVSDDRSQVLNFSIELYFGTCGSVEFTAAELPITNCKIEFEGSSGGGTFNGNGTFTSETEINGRASIASSSCVGSGSWTSWSDSTDE